MNDELSDVVADTDNEQLGRIHALELLDKMLSHPVTILREKNLTMN